MYNVLVHAHSGLRWVVLVLLVAAISHAFLKKDFGLNKQNRKFALFAMISVHVQLLIGLVLYFISPKVQFSAEVMSNAVSRFYTIEHLLGMLLAIAIITIGYSKGKKTESFKPVAIYYLIGLVLILVSIPWPFRNLGAGMS
jgi:cytochrome bd-type quinol oxidase subunit 2